MASGRTAFGARFELRLDAKTKRAISRAAKAAGIPSADWIRGCCNRALGSEPHPGKRRPAPKAAAKRP